MDRILIKDFTVDLYYNFKCRCHVVQGTNKSQN